DRLVLDLLLGMGRADLHADPAAGAVVGGDLDGELHPGQVAGTEILGCNPVRGTLQRLGGEHLGADGRVWADDGALAAVDADRRVPDGDLSGQRPLLPPRRAGPEGTVE